MSEQVSTVGELITELGGRRNSLSFVAKGTAYIYASECLEMLQTCGNIEKGTRKLVRIRKYKRQERGKICTSGDIVGIVGKGTHNRGGM